MNKSFFGNTQLTGNLLHSKQRKSEGSTAGTGKGQQSNLPGKGHERNVKGPLSKAVLNAANAFTLHHKNSEAQRSSAKAQLHTLCALLESEDSFARRFIQQRFRQFVTLFWEVERLTDPKDPEFTEAKESR
jgi:hypothetical protein